MNQSRWFKKNLLNQWLVNTVVTNHQKWRCLRSHLIKKSRRWLEQQQIRFKRNRLIRRINRLPRMFRLKVTKKKVKPMMIRYYVKRRRLLSQRFQTQLRRSL